MYILPQEWVSLRLNHDENHKIFPYCMNMSCIESPLSFKIDQTVESPAPTNNFNIV